MLATPPVQLCALKTTVFWVPQYGSSWSGPNLGQW